MTANQSITVTIVTVIVQEHNFEHGENLFNSNHLNSNNWSSIGVQERF